MFRVKLDVLPHRSRREPGEVHKMNQQPGFPALADQLLNLRSEFVIIGFFQRPQNIYFEESGPGIFLNRDAHFAPILTSAAFSPKWGLNPGLNLASLAIDQLP
jgi:hypothetical protein